MVLTFRLGDPYPGHGAPREGAIRGAGGTLSAARLQPLPFPDPPSLISLIEKDPSLVESGLRPAARQIPMPASAGGGNVDLACVDSAGRLVAILVVPRVTGSVLEAAMAARAWLGEGLPTLRALCPALAGASPEVRCLLLAGSVEPGAALLLADAAGRLEVLVATLFETSSGQAAWIRPAAPAPRAAGARREPQGPTATRRDPHAGIPVTAEEANEFRRIAVPAPLETRREAESAPALDWRRHFVEN